ncbi:MAG: hypothetical protein V2B14_06975 [bacterium]
MKITKSISLTILISIMGIQLSAIQPILAQSYKVLPPIIDQNEKSIGSDINNSANMPNLYTNNSPLRGSVSTFPVGTTFQVITNSSVNSMSNQVGEFITATLAEPITLNGNIVIPNGSDVIGQITYVEKSGRIGKNAVIDIKFTNIKLPYGQKIPMSGKIVTVDNTGILKGGSIKKQIAKTVGTGVVSTAGGTLTGLSLGGIIGNAGGGALLGTTAGGLFGLGYIFARKGKEVILPSNSKLNIILEQPLTVGR